MPATIDRVVLSAELLDGRTIVGETAITRAGASIRELSLLPEAPRPVDTAVEALRRANVILVGTRQSVYQRAAAAARAGDSRSGAASRALKIFILNLMTEPGETEGFDAIRHLEVVRPTSEIPPFDYVIFNTSPIPPHLVDRLRRAGFATDRR